jgi:hypothetical protein
MPAAPGEEGPYFTAVIEGFRSVGYVEGRNIDLNIASQMNCPNVSRAWRRSSLHRRLTH